ncbi:MAG: DNA polymerase III subunit delta' C-terminal domain-containing protein, partial [Candidatus Omnitrophota bacterium]
LSKEKMKDILLKDYGFSDAKAQSLSLFYEGRIGKAIRENFNIFDEKNRIIDAFIDNSSEDNFEIIKSGEKEKLYDYLLYLLTFYRDIWFVKMGLVRELVNSDIKEKIINSKNEYTFLELENKINFISSFVSYLDQNVNHKLLLSILRINLCKK